MFGSPPIYDVLTSCTRTSYNPWYKTEISRMGENRRKHRRVCKTKQSLWYYTISYYLTLHLQNAPFKFGNILSHYSEKLFVLGSCIWVAYEMVTNVKWAASWHNQQNCMCAQQRLRSAWASAQPDQSLRCPQRMLGSLATHWVDSKLWSDRAHA